MIKKPKRQLKVKSIFDGDTSNSEKPNVQQQQFTVQNIEQSVSISQVQPQPVAQIIKPVLPPSIRQPVTINKTVEQAHHTQVSKPVVSTQIVSLPVIQKIEKIQPVQTNLPQAQIQETNLTRSSQVKLSKIQQLKLKYLKKNLNAAPQATTISQPIRGVIETKIEKNNEQIKPQQKQQSQNNVFQNDTCIQHQSTEPNASSIIEKSASESYQTNFVPIIEQKIKSKVPPVPFKRPPPPVKNPFQLKGTYQQPNKSKQVVNTPDIFYPEMKEQQPIKQLHQHQPIIHVKEEPTHDALNLNNGVEIQQTLSNNLTYSNLIKNPQNFINQLYASKSISPIIYQLILEKLYNKSATTNEIEVSTNHPQFNIWLSKLFTNSLLKQPVISQQNESLAYQMLNEFFMPLGGNFSPVFIIVLSKLNQQYYSKYQQHLLSNPHLYVDIIANHQSFISKNKTSQFLLFIQGQLNQNLSNICEILLTMFLTSSETINEYSLNIFEQKCTFEEAVILMLIFGKLKQKFTKQNIIIANIVIQRLEENKQIQVGLELIKQLIEQLGTPAYSLLKETRQRLLRGYTTAPQEQNDTLNQVKNVTSNLFGFFNKAMDKIISKPQTQQINKPVTKIQKQPEQKQSIYFDPIKKRYVLNGQIPDDDQKQVVQVQQQAPLPPQFRITPPPAIPANNGVNKRPNRMPVNRYV